MNAYKMDTLSKKVIYVGQNGNEIYNNNSIRS